MKCNICGRERYCPFTGPPRKSDEVCKRDDSDADAEECARHGRSGETAATERWARAGERARIVAMLRADAALWPDDSKTNGAMLYLADRIERGEP